MSSIIKITRGDSSSFEIAMANESGVAIPFVTGDTVYFTVKTDVSTATKTLQKIITSFTDGKALVNIAHADTASLLTGRYVYDVQWNKADGTVTTIVKPESFIVESEVTYE